MNSISLLSRVSVLTTEGRTGSVPEPYALCVRVHYSYRPRGVATGWEGGRVVRPPPAAESKGAEKKNTLNKIFDFLP
jgi:hypothetical protein